MKTTVKLLPAINSLYEFGMTNAEIDKLTKHWLVQERKLEETDETFLSKLETKIVNKLFIAIKKENDLIISVPPQALSYATNECIYLTRLPEESILRDKLITNKIYYGYAPHGVNSHINLRSNEVLFNTLSKKDLTSVAVVHAFLSTLRDEGRKVSPVTRDNTNKFCMFTNVDDFKSLVADEILQNYENVNTCYEGNRYASDFSVKQLRELIENLYLDNQTTKGTFSKDLRRAVINDSNLRFIHSVVELHNYRFAISLYNTSSYGDSISANLTLVPHTHEHYNYVDADRIWYADSDRSYYGSEERHTFGRGMFINDEPPLPKPIVLQEYFKKQDREEVKLLSNNDLNLITKRFIQKEHRLNAEKVQKELLDKKISDKLKQLKTDKGTLKINDVVYTKENIAYQSQILRADDGHDEWVYSLLDRQTRGMDYQRITFDNVFDTFVSGTRRDKDYRPVFNQGVVGDVTFNITERSSTNVNGITSTRFYVNNYRVNTNEIHKCVERAICYEEQSDYDHFLKSISSCSIKMHRYLQLGLDVRVRDNFDHTQVVLKLPIERFKNLNYLVLNDTEYKIRDTQKLLRLEKADDIMQVINILLSGDVVLGIYPEDIKDIIDAGKQAYVDAIAKSKELLEHAEKTLGISETQIELKDGVTFSGYIVEGKLRTYAVNANDDRNSVYDYDTAQYICIVDKSNAAQVGKDMLVNRLFALHNDSVVATKINTLNKRSRANG